MARSYATDVEAAGGTVITGCEVKRLRAGDGGVRVEHSDGATEAGYVVSCAGAWADRLAVAAGADPEPRIVPVRGAYLKLKPERRELVRASIYPVPDPDLPFLGAHLTRTIDGEVLLGPSALMVGARDGYRLMQVRPGDAASTLAWPGTWRLMGRFWRYGAAEMRHAPRAAASTSGTCAATSPSCAPRTPSTARPGSGRRRSTATASWSTTSSSTAPSARCTSATPPPPPPPPRWRSPA